MKKQLWIIALCMLLSGFGIAEAREVGGLSVERGAVKLRRQSGSTVFNQQEQDIAIHNGDEIQTSGNGRATIRLSATGDTIKLFPGTLFVVSGISPESDDVYMPIGKSRLRITPRKNLKSRNRRFRLKTTNAIVGVKGTDFIVGVANGSTNLLALEGAVSLANIASPEVEVQVGLNQASQVRHNARPTAPVVVPPQAREAVIKNDAPAAFNRIQFGAEVPLEKKETDQQKDPESGQVEEPSDEPEEEIDTDEVVEEVDGIIQDVIDETETGPSQKQVIIEIVN